MKAIVYVFAAALLCVGCMTPQQAQPLAAPAQEVAPAFRQQALGIGEHLMTSDTIEDFVGRLRADVIEPGVLIFDGLMNVKGYKFTGVSGGIGLEGERTSPPSPPVPPAPAP